MQGALLFLILPSTLAAQPVTEDGRTESVLNLDRPGYDPRRIRTGAITIEPELEFGAQYDTNVYAAHENPRRDVLFVVRPSLSVQEDDGSLRWRASASGVVRRYASNPRENSESYGIAGVVSTTPTTSLSVSLGAGYRREVENRSDPEVRQNPLQGPPLFGVLNGEVNVRAGRGKLGILLKAQAERYNFVSPLDDERDFTSYRGTLRLLYQFGPAINGFVQGYANQRSFRLREPVGGATRDSRTLGGLVGVQIDPGGKIRGDIGGGIFQYDPTDPLLESFIGFALEGSLTYVPRPRTALIVDVFSGDVATVRNGATGRVDKRARLSIQQEVRHNLLARVGARYRQTHYRGVQETFSTWGGDAELEFLMGRHLSIALAAQIAKRTAKSASDRFERLRVGVEARYRY